MRLATLLLLVFAFAGISFAQGQYNQDTNFRTGPQYLDTFPPDTYLTPITTPSLSFPSQLTPAQQEQSEEVMGVTTSAPLPDVYTQYAPTPSQIYWGMPAPSPCCEQEYEEPSDEQALGPELPTNFPRGYVGLGVSKITTDRQLHEQGIGVSLAQDARYWRAHRPAIVPLYTNADIQKLQGNSGSLPQH
ncbi:MAG TPA: hypothetical protein VGR71_04615 [Nitrospira sp.]|nr:hypothetical protein [Nitrospira sp.]HEV2468752.1 hypothetical protein [Candidatus Sulfotelmatobacter sp.]